MNARADLRRGWCPGALRPMAAGDGLLVRLKPTCGILSATNAEAVADLAERYGNGRLDLSARANLQLRGVGEAVLPALTTGLRRLGLVDADGESEAVRNVIASPLAGLHAGPDIRPLVAALEARLVGDRRLHALPGKFGFVIDDGGRPSLDQVPADVRFDWVAGTERFAIGLGGTAGHALRIGTCRADELVDCAAQIAHRALGLLQQTGARRMRELLDARGAVDVAKAFCDATEPLLGRAVSPESGAPAPIAARPPRHLCVTAPYGRLDAHMLRLAADLATKGANELRLTPWRSLLLPGVADDASRRGEARDAGFIVADDDSRLAVAACVGAPECARATTATRRDADALAALAAALPGAGIRLHVSGCAKGCAKATTTAVTLVGRDGRYDLVRDGRPGDPAFAVGLDIAAARAALAGLAGR